MKTVVAKSEKTVHGSAPGRGPKSGVVHPAPDEPHYRQLAEAMDAVFWMLEPGTLKPLYVSPTYERIIGSSCASAYKTPSSLHQAIDSSDRPRLLAALREVAKGHRRRIELRLNRADGSLRWVQTRCFPILDAAGRVVRLGGLADDITERKAATDLISSLAAMLDLAGDAIVALDYEGMKIRFWNKGAESLYQYPAGEAIGRDFTDLVVPLDQDWDSLHRVLLERGEWHGEQRLRRPDKTGLVVRARSTLMRNVSGQPQSILHIATDITEQKRIERQLLRAQRLESIGTLASGLAHDLTNILSPIILSTPLLAAEIDPTVRKTIIDTIRASARRGGAIVEQILTFARGIEGERLLIDLNHLLRELLNIMEQTFPRSISLSCHGSDDLWPLVGDPTQLHQVLLNLSINARDAMPHGGTLTVTAENFIVDESFAIAVHEAKPGRYVMVQVSDTGVGIPNEIVEKIFDPFFTTKGVGEGTGLGLSSALGIVKSHAGFLMVESEVGHGTRFKVFIPASAEGAAIPASVEPVVQLRGRGETILLVDDESAFLVVISALLQEAGYKVLPSSDGTHALAAYMKHRRDVKLVITDAIMPFLDGASLTRALRQIDPAIKVIGISGHGNDGQVHELRSLKLSGFLAKPFDGPTLMAAVHRALHPTAHSEL